MLLRRGEGRNSLKEDEAGYWRFLLHCETSLRLVRWINSEGNTETPAENVISKIQTGHPPGAQKGFFCSQITKTSPRLFF